MAIHPTAVVDPAAELGNVEVGPYAVIGPGVTLHDGVRVDAHAVIYGETVIGENCRIHAFATIVERFLALYVHANSFTQLVIVSAKTGEALCTCQPKSGDLSLL